MASSTTQTATLETSASGLHRSLIIGSLATAQDGSYQEVISSQTSAGSEVEKQLLDRIIDEGEEDVTFSRDILYQRYLLDYQPRYFPLHTFRPSIYSSPPPTMRL